MSKMLTIVLAAFAASAFAGTAPKGRRIFLDFDGVMYDGTVFVNSQSCARRAGLAIRRTGSGKVVLRASADGLTPATVEFMQSASSTCSGAGN